MELNRVKAAANDLIEKTSAAAWANVTSPGDIERAIEQVSAAEDRLRDLITEHNADQNKAKKSAGDSALGLDVALHEIRVPNDKAVDAALKDSIALDRCVIREDVPDDIIHAHIRGLLVRREIEILCSPTDIADVLS